MVCPAARVTFTCTGRSVTMAPAKTSLPSSQATGTDSPVKWLLSISACPCDNTPSAGMRSPGRTSTISSIARAEGCTSCIPSEDTRRAFSGANFNSDFTPLRACPAARPSRLSPMANSNTTMPASSGSPMATAPMTATDIKNSIENSAPFKASCPARFITGRAANIAPADRA